MKKVFMTLAAVLMGMTAANAQLVIGGNVGIGGEVGQATYRDGVLTQKQSDYFKLSIAPKVGYIFGDGKMEAGAAISLGYTDQIGFGKLYINGRSSYFGSTPILKDNLKSAVKIGNIHSLNLTVTPYFRYFFLQKGIFSLGIQAHLGLGGNFYIAPTVNACKGKSESYDMTEKTYVYKDVEMTKEEAKEFNKEVKQDWKDYAQTNFEYGIYVIPVMKFDLSEHCYMDLTLNAIGLYAAGYVNSYKQQGINSETCNEQMKVSSFKGGFTGFSQGNAVSVGFAYKF